MSNNIEWAHASCGAGAVNPDDIGGDYEGLGVGEIGAWLGSDGACILYGTPEEIAAVGERLIVIAKTATPIPDPDDGTLIGILNAHMYGTPAEPGEHVDWNAPDIHEERYWESMLGWVEIENYAAASPHMIVFVLTEEWADNLGYDWQDDAIGAMR